MCSTLRQLQDRKAKYRFQSVTLENHERTIALVSREAGFQRRLNQRKKSMCMKRLQVRNCEKQSTHPKGPPIQTG